MVVLVPALSYVAAVYLGQNVKLKILVERILLVSKRLFGVPSFFNDAMPMGSTICFTPIKRASKPKEVAHRIFSSASTLGNKC